MPILLLGLAFLSHCYQPRVVISFGDTDSGSGGIPSNGCVDCLAVNKGTDLDQDNDGLIEIFTWEDLDKVRYVLKGNGRRELVDGSETSLTELFTIGEIATEEDAKYCRDDDDLTNTKLCGYELAEPLLDFCEPEHFQDITDNTLVICDGRGVPNADHPYHNEGQGWKPIGSTADADAFMAIFEGNGYEIKNLYSSGRRYSGLFAVASKARFHSLSLTELYISASAYSGGLIGRVADGDVTITNSRVKGAVSASVPSSTYAYSGGLIGRVADGDVTITDSRVSAAVSSVFSASFYAYNGGLIGHAADGDVMITNSRVEGAVSASVDSSAYVHSGGLIGRVTDGDVTITDSRMSATVSSASSASFADAYSGGLIGHAVDGDVMITNSRVSGAVSSTSTSASATSGGLIGRTNNNSVNSFDVSIISSYMSNTVVSKGGSTSSSGGLVGHVYSAVGFVNVSIANSYVRGDTISSTSSASSADAYSGGLVGYARKASDPTSLDLSIANSYVAVTTFSASAPTSSRAITGGLVATIGNAVDLSIANNNTYYLEPTSGTLPVVGSGATFDVTNHQRTMAQLQGTSSDIALNDALKAGLGAAFSFTTGEYPRLNQLLPGPDGILGSIDDTFVDSGGSSVLLAGQE